MEHEGLGVVAVGRVQVALSLVTLVGPVLLMLKNFGSEESGLTVVIVELELDAILALMSSLQL